MQERVNKNKKHFISILGKIIKQHRENLGKSIYLISAESSVPCSTWRDVKFGISSNLNLTNFYKISEGLYTPTHELLKELSDTSGKDFSFTELNN